MDRCRQTLGTAVIARQRHPVGVNLHDAAVTTAAVGMWLLRKLAAGVWLLRKLADGAWLPCTMAAVGTVPTVPWLYRCRWWHCFADGVVLASCIAAVQVAAGHSIKISCTV